MLIHTHKRPTTRYCGPDSHHSLCSINRQPGARHELAGLFAVNRVTINRDIHRIWGEIFFDGIFIFLIETSDPFT